MDLTGSTTADDARITSQVKYEGRVLHAASMEGLGEIFPLLVRVAAFCDRANFLGWPECMNFPARSALQVDLPVVGCEWSTPGVSLNDPAVVGSDWENQHWAHFRRSFQARPPHTTLSQSLCTQIRRRSVQHLHFGSRSAP